MGTLGCYLKRFSQLKRATVSGEKAPHKPILLLAVIRQFESNRIIANRILITPELVADFKDLWHQLVIGEKFSSNFSLPFFHLQSDEFWHLQTKAGLQLLKTSSGSIRSFSHLKQVVDCAYLDDDLYHLLLNKYDCEIFRHAILNTYFPHHRSLASENHLISRIVQQILHEPAKAYQNRALSFDEEEVFIRSGIFKREVPKIYNHTCCISGMRIISEDIQMVDACHIVPFAESHDDTITNGISLCPNLHRAFDRGLLSIGEDYRVMLKPFIENEDNLYSVKQFADKPILLPKNKTYFPSQYNLAKHRYKFGFS